MPKCGENVSPLLSVDFLRFNWAIDVLRACEMAAVTDLENILGCIGQEYFTAVI